MAYWLAKLAFFSICITTVFTVLARASDPDILFDYILPENITTVDGNFFTYTKLRELFEKDPKSMAASMVEFTALDGQSVSISVLRLPPGGRECTPHTTRATGLFFVLEGRVEVGFVDTANRLYTQSLQTGDMFIFPKGLVHYQYNPDSKNPATAVAAFGSASAATVSVPTSLFGTYVDDVVLAKSFKTDVATIRKLKAGLGGKAAGDRKLH